MEAQDKALLEALLQARGPGGQEDEVRALCQAELERVCDEVWMDPAGNLVGALRCGRESPGPAVLVLAHLDEIAMIVKRVEDDGSLRVVALGGAHPVNFGTCPVDVLGSSGEVQGVLSFGTMHTSGSSRQGRDVLSGNVQWEDVHVTTRRSPDELLKLGIRPGTRVVLGRPYRTPTYLPDAVAAHFLDDRAPLLAMLIAARRVAAGREQLKHDVYFVCTTMEEESNSGALYAARNLQCVRAIALEVGPIASEYATRLSADPIVNTGDSKGYYTRQVAEELMEAAQLEGYSPQAALFVEFASDASALLSTGLTPQAGCLSIPTENTHGVEIVLLEGIGACAKTLARYLLKDATPR